METGIVVANLGAMVTLLLGLLGLLAPSRAATLTSIAPIGPDGRSEIRATYGGLFLGMGMLCLLLQVEVVFITIATAWFGAAAGRFISMLLDRNFSPKNLGGICFESVIGLLLTGASW